MADPDAPQPDTELAAEVRADEGIAGERCICIRDSAGEIAIMRRDCPALVLRA